MKERGTANHTAGAELGYLTFLKSLSEYQQRSEIGRIVFFKGCEGSNLEADLLQYPAVVAHSKTLLVDPSLWTFELKHYSEEPDVIGAPVFDANQCRAPFSLRYYSSPEALRSFDRLNEDLVVRGMIYIGDDQSAVIRTLGASATREKSCARERRVAAGIDPDTLETVAYDAEMARKMPYLDYLRRLLPQQRREAIYDLSRLTWGTDNPLFMGHPKLAPELQGLGIRDLGITEPCHEVGPVEFARGHPSTGGALAHREIFKGVTTTNGSSWAWTPITENSSTENLRPMVPKAIGATTALFWLRGVLTTFTDYNLTAVGLVNNPGSDPAKLATYVDATTSNTTLASGTALSSITLTGPAIGDGALDNKWHLRSSFGSGTNSLTADESGAEDAPMLRTTVRGLPAGSYDVWALFWSKYTEDWQLKAGLTTSLSLYERKGSQHVALADLTGATVTESIDGVTKMYKAYLGRETVAADDLLRVYVDDGDGATTSPTRYDGVAYARAP